MKSNSCICSIMNFDFCITSNKPSPKTKSGRFSLRCLIVSDYVFRSMMQFELIFVYSMMYWCMDPRSFCGDDPSVSGQKVERSILLLLHWTALKTLSKITSLFMGWVSFCIFWLIFLSFCQCHDVFIIIDLYFK
jgi:hypothetical protein